MSKKTIMLGIKGTNGYAVMKEVQNFFKKLDENLTDAGIKVNFSYVEKELRCLTNLMGDNFPENVKYFPEDYNFFLQHSERDEYREQIHQHVKITACRNNWSDNVRYTIKLDYALKLWELEYNKSEFTKCIIEINGKIDCDDSNINSFYVAFKTNDSESEVTKSIYNIVLDTVVNC